MLITRIWHELSKYDGDDAVGIYVENGAYYPVYIGRSFKEVPVPLEETPSAGFPTLADAKAEVARERGNDD